MAIPIKIRLAAARVNAGLSQSDIANRMKVSRITVANWENGKTKIGEPQLIMYCDICNFPMENIFLP